MAKQNIKDPGAHHNSSGALIRRFLPYLAKHKAVLFLDLFCAALTTLCDIFLPKIMSTITNSAMGVGITLTTGIVLKLAGIYFVLRIIDGAAQYFNGLSALVRYAYANGHRRIAFIHGERTAVTENRLAGFYKSCAELGLQVPEEYVRSGVYHDPDRCAEETRALLALPQRPTCILFPDDFSAMGGCIALQEAGLSIPEDISVMGYDGIYLSRVMKPQLVTWQQNTRMLGRMAADKLVQMIEHPRVTLAEQIPVTGKLLEGGSVRSIE